MTIFTGFWLFRINFDSYQIEPSDIASPLSHEHHVYEWDELCESVRSMVLLPRDLTQNDAANAGICGDLVQSELANAALYGDLVQIESGNVGAYLRVLVRCADLKPP